MKLDKINITTKTETGTNETGIYQPDTRLKLNGKDIPFVTSFNLKHEADELHGPVLSVDLAIFNDRFEYDGCGEFEIQSIEEMDESFAKELYKKLKEKFEDKEKMVKMIAIHNNLKFGEIKNCKYSVAKDKEEERGIAGSVTFESLDKDIIETYDDNQKKFDIILKDDEKCTILLDIDILNKGDGLIIKNIEVGKEYTFVANPISRV